MTIRLAQSAKDDSLSMKTVAIMTMGFLPATFFAALFAVPSLHWDAPGVVQDRFWVYWAFTLPTTAIVFLLWFVITDQKGWRVLKACCPW
jgi:FtsH-binding integral membrane protein